MPVGVIDMLEMVEVKNKERTGRSTSAAHFYNLAALSFEAPPVCKVGQRVCEAAVLQLCYIRSYFFPPYCKSYDIGWRSPQDCFSCLYKDNQL